MYLTPPSMAFDSVYGASSGHGLVFDVPPSREVTWSAEKTRRYAVNKARALMAMDEAPNDEPRDNSATIDRMCSHAKKHFSPSDWDEFHHKVKDGYWKAMVAGEPDDDDQAEDEPPDFPGKPKRPGVKAQDEAAMDEARQAVDEPSFNRLYPGAPSARCIASSASATASDASLRSGQKPSRADLAAVALTCATECREIASANAREEGLRFSLLAQS